MEGRETAQRLIPAHAGKFIAVRDSRNRRVAGLCQRNGRYYAQLWVEQNGRKVSRRFPLLNADGTAPANLAQAKEAVEIKRHERRENALPSAGLKPSFADYCEVYFSKATVQRKGADTLYNERLAVARWKEHLGAVRVDRITPAIIHSMIERRLRGGAFVGRLLAPVAARTANLDLIALRNVLKAARDDGHLRELPRMKDLEEKPAPKRPLLTPDEFARLLNAVPTACAKNALQFTDYLRFLAFTGAREKEALRVRWSDVTSDGVTIGSDGLAKNREARTVDLNAQLAALLEEMRSRRAPDCSWLFPSPQRGQRDVGARSFRESLNMARSAAGLEWFGFHDLRHYFCSACVMAGIDFMTIATWLGHKDGGILVGKVYGHLLSQHRTQMAARLTIGAQSISLNQSEPVTPVTPS